MKILLVQTAFLGDVVLSTPVIVNLKRIFPEAELGVLTTPQAAELVRYHPAVSEVLVFDKRGAQSGIRGFREMARVIREHDFSMAFSLHKSLRTAALLKFAGISQRYGFSEAAGSWLYTKTASRGDFHHEVLRSLAILRVLGHEPDALEQELHVEVPETAEKDASVFLERLAGRPAIGIAPGSVWLTKRWITEGYLSVAREFAQRGYGIVLIGAKSDAGIAERIQAELPRSTVNLVGKTDLLVSAAVISRLKLLLTNDSAPLHIASAKKTPVIALFFATAPEFGYGPWQISSECIGVEGLGCRPCKRHGGKQCPIGTHACRRGLEPKRVIEAMDRVLENSKLRDKAHSEFREFRDKGFCSCLRSDFIEDCRDLESFNNLCQSVAERAVKEDGPRIGRGSVFIKTLASGRCVVIRRYMRGGIVRKFVESSFLNIPGCAPRPQREFEILRQLRRVGVNVPEPLGFLELFYASGQVYRGFIVTEYIEGTENLLRLGYGAREDENLRQGFVQACGLAGIEAGRMLGAGVYHRDLHLGNVLVNPNSGAFLIDFDKAKEISSPTKIGHYAKNVVSRWARSATKHDLAEQAIKPFSEGLAKTILDLSYDYGF